MLKKAYNQIIYTIYFLSKPSVKLSAPVDGKHVTNELDRLMMSTREQVLAQVKATAKELRESATDVALALNEVENMASMLRSIAVEVSSRVG